MKAVLVYPDDNDWGCRYEPFNVPCAFANGVCVTAKHKSNKYSLAYRTKGTFLLKHLYCKPMINTLCVNKAHLCCLYILKGGRGLPTTGIVVNDE